MQVDLSAAVGAFGTLLSIAALIIVAIGRVTIANREKEIDRRLDDAVKKTEAIDSRLHTEEKATIRQDGEIKRVDQSHGGLLQDVEEIKRDMVTKAEFNQLVKALERLDVRPQYIPRVTPGGYRGLSPESTSPPRPERK